MGDSRACLGPSYLDYYKENSSRVYLVRCEKDKVIVGDEKKCLRHSNQTSWDVEEPLDSLLILFDS